MRNFGITGQEATDVITKGFQIGLDASGDWLDTLWEYGVQFSDLGFTADDTLKLIANGMESGTFNTDKLADALKESKIKMLEMNEASAGAIESLGLNAETVQNNIAKGGETARNQMIELSKKILEIKDPVEQNAVAVEVFGTMFEDLGIDAVKAVSMINENMIESKGTADEVKKSYEETFGAKLTGMIERVKEPLAEIGKIFLDIAEPVIAFAGHIAEVIDLVPGLDMVIAVFVGIMAILGPIITVVGNVVVAFSNLSTAFGLISSFVTSTLIPAITGLVTTFGLPIAIITAVIGAGALLIKNWDTVKETALNLAKNISTSWDNLKNWTTEKWNSISQSISTSVTKLKTDTTNKVTELGNSISQKWTNLKTSSVNLWNSISQSVVTTVNNLKTNAINKVTELGNSISQKWNSLKSSTVNLWNNITSSVVTCANNLKSQAVSKVNELANNISQKWNSIKSSATSTWNSIKSSVASVVSNLQSTISSKISAIKNTCSSVFSSIKNILVSPFQSAKNTINNIIGSISNSISKITSALKKVKSVPTDNGSETPTSPNEEIARSFRSIKAVNPNTRNTSIMNSLNNLMKDINKLDYSSNRYRASNESLLSNLGNSGNNIAIQKELRSQNNLLTQLLNVMQNNNSDSGIHLTIENFNNNRNIDIKTLYEELEYYKYQSRLAKGGV